MITIAHDAHGKFELKLKIGGLTVAQVTGSYTIHVAPAPQPLTLTPASGALPDETVGAAASGTIAISGGTPPYALVSASGLPDGITAALGPDGVSVVLSGTPTTAGDVAPQLVVGDSAP